MKNVRLVIVSFAVWAGALSLFAADRSWNPDTGGALNASTNWNSAPQNGDTLYVKKTLTGPLTLNTEGGSEINLFGGAMMRYAGNLTVTNDFGAGNAVTNIGAGAASAMHVESGATVVHKSGKIVAYKGSQYEGTYLTGKAKLVLDGPDAIFEQRGGCVTLRSNGASGLDREYLIVTNGATLAVTNTLRIGDNAAASEGHVIVTGVGSTAVVNSTYIGYADCPNGIENTLEIYDGAHFTSSILELGRARTNDTLVVSGEGTLCSVLDDFYGRRAANVRILDRARLEAHDVQIGHNITDQSKLTIAGDAVLYATRTVALYKVDAVVDHASLIVTNGPFWVSDKAVVAVTNGLVELRDAAGSIDGSASMVLADSALAVTNKGFGASEAGSFYATNSTILIGPISMYCAWNGRTGFDGCHVEYPRVRLQAAGAELAFTNTVAHGGRIEMTKASTVRIHNSQLRLDEKDATCILMMGAGDAGDDLKRDIYVSGSNSYIYAWGSTYGLYVRGRDTTIHVSIPAEGLSTEHPLFDFKTLNFQTAAHRLKVEIDVDERLGLEGSRTYTLFHGNNASSQNIDYIYNPTNIALSVTRFPDDGYSEVYVRVRSKRGSVLLVK